MKKRVNRGARPNPQRDYQRFWEKVEKTAHGKRCWLWTGRTLPKGYGLFFAEGKTQTAPRWLYQRLMGRSLHRLEFVCHRCDTPKCVRPSHLARGTPSDKEQDMLQKGRHKRRPTCPNAHPATSENLKYWHNGSGKKQRRCLVCQADRERLKAEERNRNYSKLPAEVAAEIRRTYLPRHPEFGAGVLAKKYGVSRSLIWAVANGECWRNA